LATFLIGAPISGTYLVNSAISTQDVNYALYIHDRWRITRKLTLNLGLRYEVAQPLTERWDRLDYFDPFADFPVRVPGLPLLKGTMKFVDSKTRTPVDTSWNNWGPRFGLVYQIDSKTVFRARYGMLYSVSVANASGITGGAMSAWNQYTSTTVYTENGATPYARLSDPYPVVGPLDVVGKSRGPLTNFGLGVEAPRRDWKDIPQVQTWNAGFQRELPGSLVLSANYVGTKGTHLYPGTWPQNALGSWIETMSEAQIADLLTYVPNPFLGIITEPTSPYRFSTIQKLNLLRPYPQFTGVSTHWAPFGNSIYHALQVQVDKRLSYGLQFTSSYTWSKSIDDGSTVSGSTVYLGGTVSVQNPNNRKLERSLSEYDAPQNLKIGYTYDLPFGKGRSIGADWNPWLNAVLGGWATSGMWIFQSGWPLVLGVVGGQALPTYGLRPNLTERLRRNKAANWMDQYFANPGAAAVPPRYTVGNAPRTLPTRAPGTNTATLGLFKEFPMNALREGSRAEVRVESFNAFNRPQFSAPSTAVGTPSFGLVSGQANSPRIIQLGLKLYF